MMFDQEPQYMTEDELRAAQAQAQSDNGEQLSPAMARMILEQINDGLAKVPVYVSEDQIAMAEIVAEETARHDELRFVSADYGTDPARLVKFNANGVPERVYYDPHQVEIVTEEPIEPSGVTPIRAIPRRVGVFGNVMAAMALSGAVMLDSLSDEQAADLAGIVKLPPRQQPPTLADLPKVVQATEGITRKANKHERRAMRNLMRRQMAQHSPFWASKKGLCKQVAHSMIRKATR